MEVSVRKIGTDVSENTMSQICEWCKIELPNEPSMIQHLLGRKHRKLNTAEEDKKRVEKKCGLFIKGYPPNLNKEQIVAYFATFGKIVWLNFEYSFLLLDYDESRIAENVINRTHYLGGHKLMIKYRQSRKQVSITAPKKEETNDFLPLLKDTTPNFDEQVTLLEQNLRPAARTQFPKYHRVCDDLYNILRYAFPYCRIHPFGSTITGLGFNNSDVDVYIEGIKRGNNDTPYLYQVKHLLLNSQMFINVIVIPQAKIPILKCIHIETGINCDVNLKNMLGVCNSQLINYYLDLDSKLRRLMIILKCWAKTHKITGQNHLFTNYSLNLMLIFFLQHRPFNFPTVLMLQKNPRFHNIQDGWNGGFEPIPFKNSDLYYLPLLKLLEMFFTFYIEFDYGINVICPYMGSSISKRDFKEIDQLPNCYHTYKKFVTATGQFLKIDATVCVQDPFEHSRNTTPIISATTLELFVNFCRLGKKICQEGEGSILFKLLTEVPENLTLTVVKSQSSQFTIPMRPSLRYIEEKVTIDSERQKMWFDNLTRFTKIVLKDFLKLDLEEISNNNLEASKAKHKKVEGQADVHKEKMRVCFKCSGKLNLWSARKSTAKNNKLEGDGEKRSIVEKEIAVTEHLCSVYKDISQVDNIITFEISLEHFPDPPKVVIDIKKISAYKNSFLSFVTFLNANFPVWFKTFEQEQNDCL